MQNEYSLYTYISVVRRSKYLSYDHLKSSQVSHQSLELCKQHQGIDLELQSDLSAVWNSVRYLIQKIFLMFFSFNFFLAFFECFLQSAGIVSEDIVGLGMRKGRKSYLFHLLMSLTFSFGGRMRFAQLAGEIQSIRISLNKAGFKALNSFQWGQR